MNRLYIAGLIGIIVVIALVSFSSAVSAEARLVVQPVFFLPTDNATYSREEMSRFSDLLFAHLNLASEHWRRILRTDTFEITRDGARVYFARRPGSYYTMPKAADAAHLMLKELFDEYGDNRNTSRFIYLVIYARPAGALQGEILGGARTMNGMPGTGGAFAHLELSSLLTDKPYPFQSTLVHELGHAFGLTHPSCYGYPLSENDSVMSYNPRHHSRGLPASPGPGELNPEEYYAIALNRLAFPSFVFNPAVHNPRNKPLDHAVESCFLGEMSPYIGVISQKRSVGYELYFNGQRVNGPDAKFYSWGQALANCQYNITSKPNIKVECRFDGRAFRP